MASHILRPLRNLYTALHQDTDSAPTRFSSSTAGDDLILRDPSSYPVCNVTGHIHGIVLHDNAALPPASLASPDAHFSFIPAPPHVVESLTEVPPLDDFLPVHQTTIEEHRIPITLPNPATAEAGAIQDIVTSTITVSHYTPDTSTSTPSPSSASPAVALQHKTDLLTPSDPPNLPSSASSDPVLDDVIPTGPSLSSHSPTMRSDLSPYFPESHRSMIVTTLNTSPERTSASNLSTVAGNGGSRRDKDVGLSSMNHAIRANTVTTLDLPLPLQPLSLPSDIDSDIAAILGPSQRAERTGDHSPHPSHCWYDIV
ncbi:hypothetical protein EDB92DRAFT_1881035 [Lactarius akahatsu]|uniref:Uncharacterized protein n=1 Tax=Lactarius akahatsu TaxID=416441 RepID=A0AAD4LA11_9AGAM|nr:hypothetical protein EDB92DRAFT_1881035 [Lactarius akahatsu]